MIPKELPRPAKEAIQEATLLAETIGHAAAVGQRGLKYTVVDSWTRLPHGFDLVWLVGASGKVVRQK